MIERRFHFGPGYRVYFGRDGQELAILLGGGTKRRQSRDIARARDLWDAYLIYKRTADKTLDNDGTEGDDDAAGS